jgi:crotonobetaine/carnitine-CoA ligase
MRGGRESGERLAVWGGLERSTVTDAVARRLETDADGPLLDVNGVALTARSLDAAAAAVAAGLDAAGVRAGDRVAMLHQNAAELVVAWLATLRLGAVAVPVNTAYRGDFLRHQLVDCGAVAVIVEPRLLAHVVAVRPQLAALRLVVVTGGADVPDVTPWASLSDHGALAPVEVAPSTLATLIYTAGTTGPSKGCMLSHGYLVSLARQIAETWQRGADDVVWTPLPLFHLNAWVIAVLGTFLVGGRAVIAERFSVSGFWPAVRDCGATIASLLGAPANFIAASDAAPTPGDGTCLRLVAAAPLTGAVAARFRERFGVDTFAAGYGLTEASLISSLPPGDRNALGAAGRCNLREFDVRLFDDDDLEVATGDVGEICVRPNGPDVMFQGYWGRPDATAAVTRNLWFHTGDLGRVDADGYLYFVDRKKDCLRRRGENISSFECEAVFAAHPAVAEVAVHAVPSDAGEDDVKVTVVRAGDATVTEEELLRWSFGRLPYFAVPRYVEIRDELPRNPVGRVLKYVLRDEGVTATTFDAEAAGVEVPR